MIQNDDFIKVVIGNSACRGLIESKIKLTLVQAAHLIALEGANRATASEIAERTAKQYGVEVTPSNVGQIFSMLGIRTVTTHGKNKFVLDTDQLEKARTNIETQCREVETKMKTSIETFKELLERIQGLEKRWQEILKLKSQETQFKRSIQESGEATSRLYNLQDRAQQLREQVKQAEGLEKECEKLSQTVKGLPSLTERKEKLNSAIIQYNKEAGDIGAKEARLPQLIENLKTRRGLITLAAITEAITTADQQLTEINKQIDRNRSFLDKLLHRNLIDDKR